MRKIISLFLMLCTLFSYATCGFAAGGGNHLTEWTLNTDGAEYNETTDTVSLAFDVESSGIGQENASHLLENRESKFVLSFSMSTTDVYSSTINEGSHIRAVSLRDSQNTSDVLELIRIDDKKLKVMGEQPLDYEEISDSEKYDVKIALDFEFGKAVVWMNSQLVFEGGFSEDISEKLKAASLELVIRNNFYQRRRAAISNFSLANVFCARANNAETDTTPQNNAVLEGNTVPDIVIDFGGVPVGAVSENFGIISYADKNCYTFTEKDNVTGDIATVDFEVENAISYVKIIPVKPLGYNKTYTLTSMDFRDIFNGDNIRGVDLSFITLPEGYEAPAISLSAYKEGVASEDDSAEIYIGESILFKTAIENECSIEKVVYNINGENFEVNTSADGTYDYTFLGDEAGTFNVKVCAYDEFGASSEYVGFTVAVKENVPPQISFKNLTDDGEFLKEQLHTVEIEATDEDGNIESVEIYVDGELYETLTELPYTVDLSSLSKASHRIMAVAFDNLGAYTDAAVSIVVLGEALDNVLWEEDFSKYKGGMTDEMIGTVGSINGESILRPSTEYGEEQGGVCEWYVDRGKDNTEVPETWIGYLIPYGKNTFSFSFDYNARSFPDNLRTTLLQQYYEGSVRKNLNLVEALLKEDSLSIQNKRFSVALEEEKWYRITYVLDCNASLISAKIYDFSRGEYILETTPVAMKNTVMADVALSLRTNAVYKDNSVTRFAMDNIKIIKTVTQATIRSVGYDDITNPQTIPVERQTITVFMTNPLDSANTSDDTVTLFAGEREVSIKNISYGENIEITLNEKLRSDTLYTLKVKVPWYDESGSAVTEVLTTAFRTDFSDVDAKNVRLVKRGTGYIVTGELIDKYDTESEIVSIVTVRNGKEIKKVIVKSLILADGETFETDVFSKSDTQTVDIALWTSLTQPELIFYSAY